MLPFTFPPPLPRVYLIVLADGDAASVVLGPELLGQRSAHELPARATERKKWEADMVK